MHKHLLPAALALTAVAMAAGNAFAQKPAPWPSKPITMVVANSPGGGTDVETRMYTDRLTKVWNTPIVFDYKPGAGGALGAAQVAKAAPDGHTFLANTTSFTVTPVLRNVPYDVKKDFQAVTLISRGYIVLFATASLPVRNIKEYIAYGKANPGKLTWATSGLGAMNHLSGELFHSQIGVNATMVHYKSGSQAAIDLLAGRTSVQPGSLEGMLEHIKAGKMKVIAVLGPQRVPTMPDIPTAHEQGVTNFEQPNYSGWVTVAGTPMAIVERVAADLRKTGEEPYIRAKFQVEGSVIVHNSPAEFQKYLHAQVDRWTKVVKDNNIKVN